MPAIRTSGYNSHWSNFVTVTLGSTPSAGDTLAMIVYSENLSSVFTPPAAQTWTERATMDTAVSRARLYTRKWGTGTDSTTITTDSTQNGVAAWVTAWSDVDAAGSQWSLDNETGETTMVAPSKTASVDNSLAVWMFYWGSSHSDSPSIGTIVDAPSAALTCVAYEFDTGSSGTCSLSNAFAYMDCGSFLLAPAGGASVSDVAFSSADRIRRAVYPRRR
jgi:hypothetical protein